ncbi:MAG: hypothetical protein K1W26_07575 [Acetatifactor sp.]
MKAYLKFLILTLMIALIVFEIITLGILTLPRGRFHSSYQSMIQDKYRILKETNEPKIIMVSGSSSAFGLDQKMLEDATGYKVANLGLHMGFGYLFYTEMAKVNINAGDIVLVGYEYGWQHGFDWLDQSLIMTGIDDNIEMYTMIPPRKWPDFIGYLFKFAETKRSYTETSGIYSREAFDSETGQMTMVRDYSMEWDRELYGVIDVSNPAISESSITYLKDFKQYVEERGASIYFVAPPILADAIVCDYEDFNTLKSLEEEQIGIEFISNPTDYIFPSDLMSNAIYHCNSAGEKVRTELLIEDLRKVLQK